MNYRAKLIFVICFLLSLNSCRTNKDLTYFSNVNNNDLLPTSLSRINKYNLKEGDNLFIDIKSVEQKINTLFGSAQINTSPEVSIDFESTTAQYLRGYVVGVDGCVNLPLLGLLQVRGLTIDKTIELINKACAIYVKDAVVTVKLLNYTITVLGEVTKPGRYNNYKKNITVLDAIAMSNGLSDYAELKKILILRTTNQGVKTYRLDLTNSKCLNSEAFFLQPNDVIYVEANGYKSIKKNSPLISLMLSSISTLILVLNLL